MPRARHRWDPTCPQPTDLVRPVRRDPTGASGPTRGQARGPSWRRTSQGYYVPAATDGERPEQRILEQAVRLPEGGAVTGWAACRLWGAAFFDGLAPDGLARLPVPMVTDGHHVRHDAQVRLLRDSLPSDERVVRHGIPCVRVPRGLFDAMRGHQDLREAVVDLDMAAAAELLSVSRFDRYVEARMGVAGVPEVRRAVRLASEHSRSPNETRTRLIWVLDAGLPAPLVNASLFDTTGRLLGVGDLVDPEAGLVVEFDGADHRSAQRHSADVGREDSLRRHGLEVVRVTGLDLRDPSRVAERMLAARRRARWARPADRAWTLARPAWWQPEPSLDDVIELREVTAELHLAASRSAP